MFIDKLKVEGKKSRAGFLAILMLASIFILNLSPIKPVQAASEIPGIIYVTGDPADSSHIKNVVSNFIERAGYSCQPVKNMVFSPLKPGESASVTIPLAAADVKDNCADSEENGSGNDGHGISPADRKYGAASSKKIVIKNIWIPVIPTTLLAFSNHPEKIKDSGLLFNSGALRHKPVRLRYYHEGDPGAPAHYVSIYLLNRTKKPSKIHIIESVGGPSKDWVIAGHLNNYRFFSQLEKKQGWVEDVPADSLHLLRRVYLQPGEVISATCDLHVLEGGPLNVMVYASDTPNPEISYLLKTGEKDQHVRGAYPLTRIFSDLTFRVDEEQKYFTIGDTTMENIFGGEKIRGNYGVMYEYKITLNNPFSEEKSVGFYFQPRGGIATATFSFDGRPVSVGLTKAYDMVRLAKIKLPPNSSKTVDIQTMPEDASNYPVRLILMAD